MAFLSLSSMRLFLALVLALLGISTVQGGYYFNGPSYPSVNLAPGPFDAGDVYPLYVESTYEYTSRDVNGPLSVSVNAKDSANGDCPNCSTNLGGDIFVDLVYYGRDYTSRRKQLIENFVRNIKNHPIWGIVTQYGGGKPSLGRIVSLSCNSTCLDPYYDGQIQFRPSGSCYMCKIGSKDLYDLHGALANLYQSKHLTPDPKRIVVFLLGTENEFRFVQKEPGVQGVIMGKGNSRLCATHQYGLYDDNDYSPDPKKPGFPYIVVPLLNDATAACNFLKHNGGYPNNDFRIDTLIATLFHELVERILPRVADDWANQIADKCANRLVGIQSDYSNIVVNGEKYVLPTLWDQSTKKCSMRI